MKLFGTDGIRGIVGDDLGVMLAYKTAASVARVLKKKNNNKTLNFLIGGDTRESYKMFSCAIIAGILEEGCNVVDLGIMPTPAISYLTKTCLYDGAFIVSASHNKSIYNGIKVIDNKGFKLNEDLEKEIEDEIINFKTTKNNSVGKLNNLDNAYDIYVDYLLSTINNINNYKVLVDCANGASYKTSEMIFKKLNVDYTIINNNPDGYNINENCGSTHIENLIDIVKNEHYDIGISYDGDADRCLLVDGNGNIIDGDIIIAIVSKYLKDNNKLTNNTVVGTVMSNLGLRKYCKDNDINYVYTNVGDKYVLEEMFKNDYSIGGEQSGHIIFKEFLNTGCGELTSLQILNIMSQTGKSLNELASIMKVYPQVLVNVNVSREKKELYKTSEVILNKINEIENILMDNGRVLVRASGTENLIRVMIEGENKEEITEYANELAMVIENELK